MTGAASIGGLCYLCSGGCRRLRRRLRPGTRGSARLGHPSPGKRVALLGARQGDRREGPVPARPELLHEARPVPGLNPSPCRSAAEVSRRTRDRRLVVGRGQQVETFGEPVLHGPALLRGKKLQLIAEGGRIVPGNGFGSGTARRPGVAGDRARGLRERRARGSGWRPGGRGCCLPPRAWPRRCSGA